MRLLTAAATAALLAFAVVTPVLAHAELVSSDPADKAVISTSPTTITLTFSEDLDPALSSFKVVGPGGAVGTGKVGGVTTQMLLPGVSLAAGDYTIQWTSMSTDQHLLRGTLTFAVSAAASAPATDSPAPAQPSASPSATIASSVSTSPSPAINDLVGATQAASGDVVLPIIAALILVGVAGIYLLRRGRRA